VIVRVHIERLVVEGPVDRVGTAADLRVAVETELARTLRADGLRGTPSPGGAVAAARGPDLDARAWSSTTALGSGIARSLHRASTGVLGGTGEGR
jgi:hypothetical protein